MKNRWMYILTGLLCASPTYAGPIVAVNQAGYMVGANKIALTTAAADSFLVIDALSREAWYSGATQTGALDAATGMTPRRADSTALQRTGVYVLVVSTGDTSQHFMIADSVYAPVYRAVLKGFYFQRCGTALLPAYAGVWSHAVCHLTSDATFHATAESTGFAATSGGWHDAGDYGKYVVNAGISVGTLLMAYEYFPSKFSADNVNIPESGNGVPDILDEARYELDWLLKMQAANGGVFFKITKTQFEGFVMPNLDTGPRYIYQLSSTATGDFAAMMARASRVYRPFDAGFADTCLAASSRAWVWLQAHPSIVPVGGFQNPPGTGTGVYGDGNDSDERLWAASELYIANGDSTARNYFVGHYASSGIITNAMGWGSVKPLAVCTYLLGTQPDINTTIKNNIRQSLLTFCQSAYTQSHSSAFGTALTVNDYYWGSNSVALNNAVLLLLGFLEGGSQTYEDAALSQLHYILGFNGLAHSFVTGIGGNSTLHPHHRPSGSDGIAAPVPGLMSGGPDHSITDDAVLSAHFTSSTPPALCYVDDQGSYASNEIAINWNAPLVFVAGYFAREGGPSSVSQPGKTVPRVMALLQNYPNPFNPSTNIGYTIASSKEQVAGSTKQVGMERVRLAVYDLLGREVAVLVDGYQLAGQHQLMFDARGLSSGIYFYRLSAGGQVAVKRMVLVR